MVRTFLSILLICVMFVPCDSFAVGKGLLSFLGSKDRGVHEENKTATSTPVQISFSTTQPERDDVKKLPANLFKAVEKKENNLVFAPETLDHGQIRKIIFAKNINERSATESQDIGNNIL